MTRSVLKSLLKAEAYSEPTTRVEMVQTHVSWIFLTDSHAYKIKKPVDFGFLNFSTIDRRRFYCNEEVKYNRRLCPDIYEGVVELRQTNDGASFIGTGPVIDFAVKMKRLPADRMLDRLVIKGLVSDDQIRHVAEVIADFHRRAPTSPDIASHGTLERILYNWNENFEQMTPFARFTLPARERDYLKGWVEEFIATNAALFNERLSNGFIRECDGDIHLENICVQDDSVCIFDCIEFSDRFRCCDTAADIAFLLMDLDFHDRRDLSRIAAEAYQQVSRDEGFPELLDFYKIYRAFIRGKVESFRLDDQYLEEGERTRIAEKAIRYFRLATGYILNRRMSTTLFITCGLMGSGKSTLARQIHRDLDLAVFNSDGIRKTLAGLAPETPVMIPFGEGIYSVDNSRQTYAEMLRQAKSELAAGRSVILDASFIRREERTACRQTARQYGADFVILHLSCEETEHRKRLAERARGARTVSDGRMELLHHQQKQYEPPDESEGTLITLNAADSPVRMAGTIYERIG